MDRLIKNQLANTQTLVSIKYDIERRFKYSVIDLIELMQEGVGYVAFNKESGFPEIKFWGETYDVLGVMVRLNKESENKMLCVYINDKEIDKMSNCKITDTYGGWFIITYHSIDYNELFDCLALIINKDE